MKTIYIIRHAKSDQRFFGNDFERPLNERGLQDAPLMAGRLAAKNIKIDQLIASPASRAKKTAELFAETLNIPKEEIIFISALYHASADVFYEEIAALPDDLSAVAMFSHNPGITHFVNSLNTKSPVNNMPTCGIFAVSAEISNWASFSNSGKKCLFFDYPKSGS